MSIEVYCITKPTQAVDKGILVPPEAPTTMTTSPFLSVMIVGHVEDKGRLPAAGAFIIGVFGYPGYEALLKKSATSLL